MATARAGGSSVARRHRSLGIGLVVSVLLHATAGYLLEDLGRESPAVAAFHARLAQIPRFVPRRLAAGPRPAAVPTTMEHLASPPQAVESVALPAATPEPWRSLQAGSPQPLALRAPGVQGKAEQPRLERVHMVAPTEVGLADSATQRSLDLLRLVDRARANRQHALVMRDPNSRRDLLGYLNLARIKLYGAGTTGSALDGLARYVRDHSHILVQVAPQDRRYFLSPELLKDPLLFLFQGSGYEAYSDTALSRFSAEERAHLGTYLRHGGFLFVEGENRYLREMAGHLRQVLGREGRLFPLPSTHPLYHSYFDFDDGFPGEEGKHVSSAAAAARGWHYPALAADDAATEAAPGSFGPGQAQSDGEAALPLGLWGVEWHGQTVAVLSDAKLHQIWGESFNPSGTSAPLGPVLNAGMNIIFYALTRDGSLTPQQERPTWLAVRPQLPSAVAADTAAGEMIVPDDELLSALDATLAVVRAPPGRRLDGTPLVLRLNGGYTLRLPSPRSHGLLLHNMPPGRHWLEVTYGGRTRQIRVLLVGGQVTTLTFGVDRFVFLQRLRLRQEARRVPMESWRTEFADLQMEEFYLAEDRQQIDSAARAGDR